MTLLGLDWHSAIDEKVEELQLRDGLELKDGLLRALRSVLHVLGCAHPRIGNSAAVGLTRIGWLMLEATGGNEPLTFWLLLLVCEDWCVQCAGYIYAS